MQLGWLDQHASDLEFRRVILHELGHALGFIHEHQNPLARIPWNSPVVLDFYARTQGWSPEMTIAQILGGYDPLEIRAKPYDRRSIMHYSFPPEFVSDPAFVAPFNTVLSEGDRKHVAEFYGPPKPNRSYHRGA